MEAQEIPWQVPGDGDGAKLTTLQVARWCRITVSAYGSVDYTIDTTKIVNPSAPREAQDQARDEANDNIVKCISGQTVNSDIWPLLFSGSESNDVDDHSITNLRSLAYMRQLLAGDTTTSRRRFESLSGSEKRAVALGVRDLYLTRWRGLLDTNEEGLLHSITAYITDPVDLDSHLGPSESSCARGEHFITVKNLPVSFHPSANFKMLRFIENINHYIPKEHKGLAPYFAQILAEPKIYAVFVNPADLSYHNFENIVPLDSWLGSKAEDLLVTYGQPDEQAPLSQASPEKNKLAPLALKDIQRLQPSSTQVLTSTLTLNYPSNHGTSALNQLFFDLEALNLFIPPLNASTRGGERFIFHSNLLSRSLTHAIRESGLLEHLAVPSTSFRFTNYIFRLNRFRAGDDKFSCHRDTPYYDAARGHVSRYTLLLYLTSGVSTINTNKDAVHRRHEQGGGHGHPVLRITTDDGDAVVIDEIQPMQCIIFDQRLEHEGYPFIEGDKVFLRTELIFDLNDLNNSELGDAAVVMHDPSVGELFARACYFTSMAATTTSSGTGDDGSEMQVFQDELSRHAHECYEKVNAMHWGLQHGRTKREEKRADAESGVTNELGKDDGGMESGLLFIKDFAGLSFVTNGYHYWFAKEDKLKGRVHASSQEENSHLKNCAMVAVLDYFNCRLDGTSFRKLCHVTPVQHKMDSDEDMWETLNSNTTSPSNKSKAPGLRKLNSADLHNLIKTKPYKPFIKRACPWMDEEDEEDHQEDERIEKEADAAAAACCPFHDYQNFDAWDSTNVYDDIYTPCCEYTRSQILRSPIVFLDEEVVVNEKQILVEGDKIYILRDEKVEVKMKEEGNEDVVQDPPPYGRDVHGRINFAACWNSIPPTAFVGLEREISAPQMLVPPMQFYEVEKGGEAGFYHLMLDFFGNDWVVDVDKDRTIPVPIITNEIRGDVEEEDEGGSEFLKRLPGIRREFGRPMEIISEEEKRVEDEKFNARRDGRRSGRRRHIHSPGRLERPRDGADLQNDDDVDLIEIADQDWETESEAEATDEERDELRRRRRQEWLSIDSEVDIDDEDLDEDEDRREVEEGSEKSDSDAAPRKRLKRI